VNQLLKVSLILTIINAIILYLAYLIGGVFQQAQIASVTGIAVIIVIQILSFFFSDKLVLISSGARSILIQDAPEVFSIVKKLAQKAKIPEPKLYLIQSNSLNAFTTGRSQKKSIIVLTRGIIEQLSTDELTGVIAHEIAHIKQNDVRLMTYISVAVGCISLLAELLYQSQIYGKASEKDSTGILHWIAMLLAIFSPLVATIFQFTLSRTREYYADQTGAHLVGSPLGLINALRKISRDHQPLPASYATAHLYISNPFKTDGFMDTIFSTHPPIDKRIIALERENI
jgi:heat shock protein HtpX